RLLLLLSPGRRVSRRLARILRGAGPTSQRPPPDQGQGSVGGDPVARAKLSDEVGGVTRGPSLAAAGEPVAAGADVPPAGIQRAQRDALFVGRHVQRMRAGAGGLRRRRLALYLRVRVRALRPILGAGLVVPAVVEERVAAGQVLVQPLSRG